MKILPHKIEVESNLILNKRELELLHHIFSFNNKEQFVAGMESSYYAGGVTKQEMLNFIETIHSNTTNMINSINKTKDIVIG